MITIATAVTIVWISFMVVVHHKCKLQKSPKGPYLFPPHPDMEPSVLWPSRPGSAAMSDVSYSSHWDKNSQLEWDWDNGINVDAPNGAEDDTYMTAQDVDTEPFPSPGFKGNMQMYTPGRSKFVRNVTDTHTDTEFQNAHDLGCDHRLKNIMRSDTQHSHKGTDIYSLAVHDGGMRGHGNGRGNLLKDVMRSDQIRHSDEGTDIYSLAIQEDSRHKFIQLESNYELGTNNNVPEYGESECDYELGSNNNAHFPEGTYDLGSNTMHRLGSQFSVEWDCDGYDVINPSPTDASSDYASDTLGGSAIGGSRRPTGESETEYMTATSSNSIDFQNNTRSKNGSEMDTEATSILAARVATRRRDRSSRKHESHDGSFSDSHDSRTELHTNTLGSRRMPSGSSLQSRKLSSSMFLPKGQLEGQQPQNEHHSGIDMSMFFDNGVHDQPRDFVVLPNKNQMDVYDNLDSFGTNPSLRRLTLQEDDEEEEA